MVPTRIINDTSVKWNPFNNVVQSHIDGTIYVPVKKYWSREDPTEEKLYICRLRNMKIQTYHWRDGNFYRPESTLDIVTINVLEWMHIPYDNK